MERKATTRLTLNEYLRKAILSEYLRKATMLMNYSANVITNMCVCTDEITSSMKWRGVAWHMQAFNYLMYQQDEEHVSACISKMKDKSNRANNKHACNRKEILACCTVRKYLEGPALPCCALPAPSSYCHLQTRL